MLERVKQHPVKFPVWRVENDTLYKYVKPTIPDLSFYGDDWKIVFLKTEERIFFIAVMTNQPPVMLAFIKRLGSCFNITIGQK